MNLSVQILMDVIPRRLSLPLMQSRTPDPNCNGECVALHLLIEFAQSSEASGQDAAVQANIRPLPTHHLDSDFDLIQDMALSEHEVSLFYVQSLHHHRGGGGGGGGWMAGEFHRAAGASSGRGSFESSADADTVTTTSGSLGDLFSGDRAAAAAGGSGGNSSSWNASGGSTMSGGGDGGGGGAGGGQRDSSPSSVGGRRGSGGCGGANEVSSVMHAPPGAAQALPGKVIEGTAGYCSALPRSRAFLHPSDWFRAFDVERMDDHM